MRFSLHKIYPKEKALGNGDLCVGKDKDAQFFENALDRNGKILAFMERVTMEWVGAETMKITGFENVGYDRQQQKKFIYQEWYLRKETA